MVECHTASKVDSKKVNQKTVPNFLNETTKKKVKLTECREGRAFACGRNNEI